MEKPSSNSGRNLLLLLAVLAVCACGCMTCTLVGAWGLGLAAFGAANVEEEGFMDVVSGLGGTDRASAERAADEAFEVGSIADLTLDIDVGEVTVDATDGQRIVVTGRVRAWGLNNVEARERLDRVQLTFEHEGDKLRIETDVDAPAGGWSGRSPRVELLIEVPRRTTVTATANVGDVRVRNTTGDLDISTDVGRVDVQDVRVERALTIVSDVASIGFAGALTEGAEYELQSDVGRISMVLPADSRFELDARSDIGAVDVGFDVRGEHSGRLVGRTVTGAVNGGGSTTVTARSNVGAVRIDASP